MNNLTTINEQNMNCAKEAECRAVDKPLEAVKAEVSSADMLSSEAASVEPASTDAPPVKETDRQTTEATAALPASLYPKEVRLAEEAGFCMGVQLAVDEAYQLLRQGQQEGRAVPFYMYGELIHNKKVVEDFLKAGARLVRDISEVPEGERLLVRAHGISPQERQQMHARKLEIVDGTCGYVHRIHQLVKKAHQNGEKILLIGSKSHPEIQGICGECEHQAVILSGLEEVEDFVKSGISADTPLLLAAQTTYSLQMFEKICELISAKFTKSRIFATICKATENRQRAAKVLAHDSDVVIVIGSKGSSNTMKLLETCSNACSDTYLVEDPSQVRQLLTEGKLQNKRVGVTAGASSPESIIREVLHQMSEKEVANQKETNELSFSELIETIPQLKRGQIVKGFITSYDDENVYVDVNDKSEGKIPRSEFDSDPDFDLDKAKQERAEIEVYVKNIRNTDMGKDIVLSKKQVDYSKHRAEVEAAFQNKTPILTKIVSVVKDGVIATYGAIDIYVHRSQLELGMVEDLSAYKDRLLEILVTQFEKDPNRRRMKISGSRRSLLAAERKAKAAEIWNNMQIGDICDGVVRSLTDFGAFVDIGGVDGLVHVSELSWNHIKHPSEVVKVGDEVQVYIKEFDPERKRISLGYKRIEDDPYYNIEERYPLGSVVKGKVARMFPFGAFVELAPGVDALCHISQISNVRLNKPQEVLKVGMEVEAKVREVSSEARRISISIKDVNPIDPHREEAPVQKAEEELPTQYIDREENPEHPDYVG